MRTTRAIRSGAAVAVVALTVGLAACGGEDRTTSLAGARGIETPTTSTVVDARAEFTPDAGVPAPTSLAELYARMGASVRALDGVYHAVRTRTPRAGTTITTEVWVDGRRELGKRRGPDGDVVVAGGAASGGAPGAPTLVACHGAPLVLTLVLDCTQTIDDNGSVVIRGGTSAGRKLVAVVSKGDALPTGSGEGEPRGSYQRTVLLDADTLLPVRIEVVGDAVGEVPFAADSTVTFDVEVLPAAGFPDTFFTTAG